MKIIHYNEIVILENLKPDDNSARKLYGDLIHYRGKDGKFDLLYEKFESLEDLKRKLTSIKEKMKSDRRFPILHFEVHGSINGLVLNSEERITWEEMNNELVKINIAARCNLIVAMGVCFGGRIDFNAIIRAVSENGRSPYFGLLGSQREMYNDEIYEDFFAFYKALLNGASFEEAFEHVTGSLELYSSEKNIDTLVREAKKDFGSPNFNAICVEALDNWLKQGQDPLPGKPYKEKLEKVKEFQQLRSLNKLKAIRERFLMIDLFPEEGKLFKKFEDI
ncbi:MAG: hypothetical protein NW218_02795 [Saprospiraceae bacterium]|nr:hypothetical protein [Saprospiraceae bacterium]